jgi:hypothetical protein
MASKYVELMTKRKEALFEGDEAKAAEILILAEELAERGKVTDEEFLAAAYL